MSFADDIVEKSNELKAANIAKEKATQKQFQATKKELQKVFEIEEKIIDTDLNSLEKLVISGGKVSVSKTTYVTYSGLIDPCPKWVVSQGDKHLFTLSLHNSRQRHEEPYDRGGFITDKRKVWCTDHLGLTLQIEGESPYKTIDSYKYVKPYIKEYMVKLVGGN